MLHDDAPLIQKDHRRNFGVLYRVHDLLIMKNVRNYELRSGQPQANDRLLSLAHSYESIHEALGRNYLEIIFEIEYLDAPINQVLFEYALTLHSLFQP